MIRHNRATLMLLVALLLGWSWDLLFYGKALGVSVPIFVLLLMVALFGLGKVSGGRPNWHGLWLCIPLFFFAAMISVRANPILSFLNFAASLVLLGLIFHFYATGRVENLGLLDYPFVLAKTGFNTLSRPAPLVSSSIDLNTAYKQSRRGIIPMIRGFALALPVVGVFSCFLASADLVFARYIEGLFNLRFITDVAELTWRGTFILGVAWVVLGSFAYATRRQCSGDDGEGLKRALSNIKLVISPGFVETATLLISINLLFLVFVWIQFAYLFGGRTTIALQGYTYAEYARRGFFELLAVSILTLVIILTVHQLARWQSTRQKTAINGLSSIMVGLVLVILASAFQRLLIYEDMFGYTQLRLFSHVFMVWLAFTFVWLWAVLWLQPHRFALGAFVSALGFLVTLNLINPDALVAERNLARYATTGKLDLVYLTTLSEDVVPVLVSAKDQLATDDQQLLEEHLRKRSARMAENSDWQSWPSFHFSRWRTYNMLVQHQPEPD